MKGGPALHWLARYKVALGIAEAIEYLHNGTERCVVHRDIKPSNILLSSKKMPKVRKLNKFIFLIYLSSKLAILKFIVIFVQLCDFGLASWTPAPSMPFLCRTVKGTFGYDFYNSI